MSIFRRKKACFFPDDTAGRRRVIMDVHRQVSGDDRVRDPSILDLVLEQIFDETDPFFVDSYLIYYIGTYKPFESGNEETAKVLADGILADSGFEIPQTDVALSHLSQSFCGQHTIDSIVEWQRNHAVRRR
ncbi:MAG: hypothetical protein MJZ38_04025 [archaeon]|nr:hypothetical protein [archaeon]